jgi:hypothetical protein
LESEGDVAKIKVAYLDGTREIRFRDENGVTASIRARADGTVDVDELTLLLIEQAGHKVELIDDGEPTDVEADGNSA